MNELFPKVNNNEKDSKMPIAIKLPSGDFLMSVGPFDNMESALEVYFQVGDLRDHKNSCLTKLFVQIFANDFFSTLRTKEQLGYIVSNQTRIKYSANGLRFLVQSTRSPSFLKERINEYISSLAEKLANISEKEFNNYKKALKHLLLTKKKTQIEDAESSWYEILVMHNDFERQVTESKVLEAFSIKDVIDFYNNYISSLSNTRSTISIAIWSEKVKDEKEVFESIHSNIIRNFTEFSSSMKGFPIEYNP